MCLIATHALAQSYTFTHLAGSAGGVGFDDGTGAAARFQGAQELAVDGDGNIFVADALNHTIRKITPEGEVTTIAGVAGSRGTTDGRGAAARFRGPTGIAIDRDGALYVADTENDSIRKITTSGFVATFAGGSLNPGKSDGPVTAARFYRPSAIAIDSDGTLYIADAMNLTIRKITPDGVVTTIAGLAGRSGSADGTASAARFQSLHGLDIDAQGLVVVDGNRIRRITRDGVVTTIAGSLTAGSADGTGDAARFSGPVGCAVDAAGTIYVADTQNHTIRQITSDGAVTTFAGLAGAPGGNDGTGAAARFRDPLGVAVDAAGDLVVAAGGAIRKITSAGVVTTIAGMTALLGSSDGAGDEARFETPRGVAMDSAGNLIVSDGSNHTIRKVTPDGGVSTFAGLAPFSGFSDGTASAARFNVPIGVAVDAAGNTIVADTRNYKIRRITPSGEVSTLSTSNELTYPSAVATDSLGNVFVVQNGTIQKIDAAGAITTVAGLWGAIGINDGNGSTARFNDPQGLVVDSAGTIYVADSANHMIRKISPSGDVSTLAGLGQVRGGIDGTGSAARFSYPSGLSVDGRGDLYVTDNGNHTIRKVTPDGVVTTIGGVRGQAGSADGTGSAARFNRPYGVRVDSAGNLYVADLEHATIRKGVPALEDVATIDAAAGPVGQMRQLGTSAHLATTWHWDLIRRPSLSHAALSDPNISNPTFTPDVADLYVFRLRAANATATSVTTVELLAGAATTTALTRTSKSSGCSEAKTFTATVTSDAAGSLSGSVIFKNYADVLGMVDLSSGQASITVSLLPVQYSVTAEYSGDATHQASISPILLENVTADVPTAPASVVATATSTSQITVSWSPSPCATRYDILRRATTDGFVWHSISQSLSFVDNGLTPGSTYLYIVRAVNTAGTADSAIEGATTILFTDDTLIEGVTPIKAAHITELRSAVNAFRANAGPPAFPFTDMTLTAGNAMRTQHLTDLREALDAARATLGLSALAYTDPAISGGSTPIKAAHFQELRQAVK
ncbi:MAG TPA: Ig-like domain repeat protein [Thermoanaerobaculia bacterium]|nr:Ig-like domain repeat protein [Thermoanaerobaculia bacterium]